MVVYEDEELISAPRDVVWKLLDDHLNEAKVVEIHPLIRSQTTVRLSDSQVVLDRVIDVNRKPKRSRWKVACERPDRVRWEILESEGPWTRGSYLELTYHELPWGTKVGAHGELEVAARSLFLSPERAVAVVLNDLHTEDLAYLRRYRF